MSDCTSTVRITGTDTHAGTVVTCDAHGEGHEYHGGPVPGAPEGTRYAWTDAEALTDDDDAVSLGETHEMPCGHTHAEHLEMGADVMEGHADGLARLLAGVFGIPAERVQVNDHREPKDEPTDVLDTMLAGLKQMEDVHAAILGAAQRHRAACEAAGFSPAAAEGLAFQFYMQALGK